MRLLVGALLAMLFLAPAPLWAHRLDEYLQATRISVSRERIALELDLTPGAAVASEIATLIDRDRDGRIAPAEAYRYASTVLADIVLLLDGRAVPFTLTHVDVPAIAVMREGMGAIRIDASAVVGDRTAARHDLVYRNDHHPDASVYLVNAMIPATRAVSIETQHRDIRQREFRLVFRVGRYGRALEWTIAAAVLLGTLTASRRRVNASIASAG